MLVSLAVCWVVEVVVVDGARANEDVCHQRDVGLTPGDAGIVLAVLVDEVVGGDDDEVYEVVAGSFVSGTLVLEGLSGTLVLEGTT